MQANNSLFPDGATEHAHAALPPDLYSSYYASNTDHMIDTNDGEISLPESNVTGQFMMNSGVSE